MKTRRKSKNLRPLSDQNAKKLFASKPFLAHILKGTVSELSEFSIQDIMSLCLNTDIAITSVPVFDPNTPDEILKFQDESNRLDPPLRDNSHIVGRNVEDNSSVEGKVTFDIAFDLQIPQANHERVAVIINVEIQDPNASIEKITKRSIYYSSRLISSQRNTVFCDMEYQKLRKVYSIWLLAGAGSYFRDAIQRISLKNDNLIKLNGRQRRLPAAYYDMQEIIIVGVSDAYKPQSVPNVMELLWTVSTTQMTYLQKRQYLEETFNMEITSQMSTELRDVMQEFRNYYGDRKFRQMCKEAREEIRQEHKKLKQECREAKKECKIAQKERATAQRECETAQRKCETAQRKCETAQRECEKLREKQDKYLSEKEGYVINMLKTGCGLETVAQTFELPPQEIKAIASRHKFKLS